MDTLAKNVRKFVYDRLRVTAQPPLAEEVARQFELDRQNAVETLKLLEVNRMLVLLPGTARILMAHPFSAITTPFRVTQNGGQEFFANCAYDSIAMHLTLEEDVKVTSFCHYCCETIEIELADETVRTCRPKDTIVYLGLPFARWWDDMVYTCSNTMLFFSNKDHLDAWLETNHITDPGQALTIDQALRLGGPTFKGRMDVDYEKPAPTELSKHFESLGLTGEFWQVG